MARSLATWPWFAFSKRPTRRPPAPTSSTSAVCRWLVTRTVPSRVSPASSRLPAAASRTTRRAAPPSRPARASSAASASAGAPDDDRGAPSPVASCQRSKARSGAPWARGRSRAKRRPRRSRARSASRARANAAPGDAGARRAGSGRLVAGFFRQAPSQSSCVFAGVGGAVVLSVAAKRGFTWVVLCRGLFDDVRRRCFKEMVCCLPIVRFLSFWRAASPSDARIASERLQKSAHRFVEVVEVLLTLASENQQMLNELWCVA